MRNFRRTRSRDDRDAERRQRRLEKLRSRLPQAAVTRCEASSEGDHLLRALECLDKIAQNPIVPIVPLLGGWGSPYAHVGLVGTIEHPPSVADLSTESHLDTLIASILRESAVGAPGVRDVMIVAFARASRYGQHRELRSTSSEHDIAETVGDRILVTVGAQAISSYQLSSFAAAASPIEHEEIHFGVYGRIGIGSSAESESPLERRGIQLAGQGDYAEARGIFERVLTMRAEPLHRAQVLQNIMRTYIREGNEARAIETGQDILELFGLMETTDGTYLHGQIVGQLRRGVFG